MSTHGARWGILAIDASKVRFKMRETYCKIGYIFVPSSCIHDFSPGSCSDGRKLNFQSWVDEEKWNFRGKNERRKIGYFWRTRVCMPCCGLKESSLHGLSKCAILFEEITLLLDTATIEVRDLTTFDAPAVLSKTGVVSVRNASWKYVAYRSLYSRTDSFKWWSKQEPSTLKRRGPKSYCVNVSRHDNIIAIAT